MNPSSQNRGARPSLDGKHFDVVIIGGGISGVAIALECARGGKRTLLVEQNDFASGTTSRSTRIIHGGLRYLEHGEFGLVRECLRDRERLLREQPHLVRPVQFVLALKAGSRHSALAVRAGLWLYKILAGRQKHHDIPKSDVRRLEEQLDNGAKLSTFSYEDAQCEFPELLVAEWITEATQLGCEVRNHARALDLKVKDGRACGVFFRDLLDGCEQSVEATWIINATGPWCDHVNQQFPLRERKRLVGGVRGSHIVLPSFPGMPQSVLYTEAADRRPFFVIPWNHQLLVGTTEVVDEQDPADTKPSHAEIDYLLRSVAALFPQQRFTNHDIRYALAGVRPLPYSPGENAGAITRRHFLHDHKEEGAAGLISIIGGKLTNAASLARLCADKIGVRKQNAKRAQMALVSGESLETSLQQWPQQIAQVGKISEASARAIAEWHGPSAIEIARLASSSEQYCLPLCRHSEHLVAEAVMAFTSQYAVTLGDVLLRRVPVALGACWSKECSTDAANRIGKALGWSGQTIQQASEELEDERIKFLNPAVGSQFLTGPGSSQAGEYAAK